MHKDTLFVYGGLIEADSNKNIYALNLETMNWTIVDQSHLESIPVERDDHAACTSTDDDAMFIFGGYVNGGKANDLWKFDYEKNEWFEIDKGDYLVTDLKELAQH